MKLDTPTLMLAIVIGFLLLSMQLWNAQRGVLRQVELQDWARGSWVMLAGFVVLIARVWIPLGLSVTVGSALVFLGVSLYGQALYRYVLNQPLPRYQWVALALAVLLSTLAQGLDHATRTGLNSFLITALLLMPVLLVLRHSSSTEASMRSVGFSLSLTLVMMFLRGIHAFVWPQDYADLLQSSFGQGITFLVCFMGLLGSGFGFVLASFERVAKRMEEMASLDGLTGCLNRSTTDALLAHTLERGRREGAPVAFALLDLDHFKGINDRFGHQAGDAALRAFCDEVRRRLRSSDVLGRMGGEEFGLVLPATDAPGAARLLEQIRAAVEALDLSNAQGTHFRMTVSAGVVVAASDSGITADRLYMQADKALYRAKDLGRNRTQLGEEAVPAAAVRPPVAEQAVSVLGAVAGAGKAQPVRPEI